MGAFTVWVDHFEYRIDFDDDSHGTCFCLSPVWGVLVFFVGSMGDHTIPPPKCDLLGVTLGVNVTLAG